MLISTFGESFDVLLHGGSAQLIGSPRSLFTQRWWL
jgi:hypothetical protein